MPINLPLEASSAIFDEHTNLSNKKGSFIMRYIIIFSIIALSACVLLGQTGKCETAPSGLLIKGKILFDESHHQFWTACIDSALNYYADELRKEGYQVDRFTEDQGPITYDKLKEYDILAFPNGFAGKHDFSEGVKLLSDSEIDAIKQFVSEGRGLALFECGWSWTQYTGLSIEEAPINQLGTIFGFTLNDDMIHDPTNYCDNLGDACPMFYGSFIKSHPITEGISEISNCEGMPSSLTIHNPLVEVLITGDEDAYSNSYASGELPPFLAATKYGKGRVVLFGQVGFFTSLDGNGDGVKNIYEFDNLKLALNIMEWLNDQVSDVHPEMNEPGMNEGQITIGDQKATGLGFGTAANDIRVISNQAEGATIQEDYIEGA